jgi:hypothetical protein
VTERPQNRCRTALLQFVRIQGYHYGYGAVVAAYLQNVEQGIFLTNPDNGGKP